MMRKAVTENEYSKSAWNLVSFAHVKWKFKETGTRTYKVQTAA